MEFNVKHTLKKKKKILTPTPSQQAFQVHLVSNSYAPEFPYKGNTLSNMHYWILPKIDIFLSITLFLAHVCGGGEEGGNSD